MSIGSEMKENHKGSLPKVTVIFPAKNEAGTIKACMDAVKQSKYKPSIVLADGYSTDDTRSIAEENGAEVVMSEKRMHPGKGAAMKAGLEAALAKKPDIIVFLDSDLKNLTSEWLDKLVGAIDEDHYDMSRGTYLRSPRDAGVTKLVARPLLGVFFPELAHFDQPLSGEVAAKAKVWKELLDNEPPDGWGVDVWFLIETAMHSGKIREVFLGTKEHASFQAYADDVATLAKMGEQVALAIVREAIKHNRIDNARVTCS
ncbi:MAG TPA: glycosyltransferase [Candidatus Sulfotelmatobacter sp.]|nr:glycosyltransferase [Candidatus Sulfotelmatobacter sp.]